MKRTAQFICTAAVVILCVIGWFILPETVVVQITSRGEAGSTIPKLAAVVLPAVICGIGLFAGKNDVNGNGFKGLFLCVVGLVIIGATFLMNR